MSANQTLNEALRGILTNTANGLGSTVVSSSLSKGPHSKNISIDDWNTLVHILETSSADVERLYTLLTEVFAKLNGDLQIKVPLDPEDPRHAASRGYIDHITGDLESEDLMGLDSLSATIRHMLYDTAHKITLHLSDRSEGSAGDYKLTVKLWAADHEDASATPISEATVDFPLEDLFESVLVSEDANTVTVTLVTGQIVTIDTTAAVLSILRTVIHRIETGEASSLEYALNDDGTAYTCVGKGVASTKNISVASEYEGKPVTAISEDAFKNWNTVESITVPKSVENIGKGAFSGCSSLRRIVLPFVGGNAAPEVSGVDTVFGFIFGDVAYEGSVAVSQLYAENTEASGSLSVTYHIPTSLESVTLLGGTLHYGAFSGCNTLSEILLNSELTVLPDGAFAYCTKLSKIIIPNSVSIIGTSTFRNCTSLHNVDLPTALTSIGYAAFYGCAGLNTVKIPDNVSSIADYAFTDCSGLESVIIPSKVTTLGKCAFESCTRLSTVTFAKDVALTTLSEKVFVNCRSLVSVTIPDSVTSIGVEAFRNCESLTSLTFGTGLADIGDGAFLGCSKITTLSFPETLKLLKDYVFSGCTSLRHLTLNKVENISRFAFENCIGLTTLRIPTTVTTIQANAFAGCSDLVVCCDAATLPEGWEDGWATPVAIYWNGGRLDTLIKDISKETNVDLNNFTTALKNSFNGVRLNDDPNSDGYGVITFDRVGADSISIDLPLELLISTDPTKSYYDSAREILVIGLASGQQIEIPLEDILNAVEAAVEAAEAAKSEAIIAKDEAIAAKQGADSALAQANQAVTNANAAVTAANTAKNEAVAAKNAAEDLAEEFSDSLDTVDSLKPMLYNSLLGPDVRSKVQTTATGAPNTSNPGSISPRYSVIGGAGLRDITSEEAILLGNYCDNVSAFRSAVFGTSMGDVDVLQSVISAAGLGSAEARQSIICGYWGYSYDQAHLDLMDSILAGRNSWGTLRYSIAAGSELRLQNVEGTACAGLDITVEAMDDTDTSRLRGLAMFGSNIDVHNAKCSIVAGNDIRLGDYVMRDSNARIGTAIFGAEHSVNSNYSLVCGQGHTVGSQGTASAAGRYVSYCLVAGQGHYPTGYWQTLVGKYSQSHYQTLFAVGDGESNLDRHNAFEIRGPRGNCVAYLNGSPFKTLKAKSIEITDGAGTLSFDEQVGFVRLRLLYARFGGPGNECLSACAMPVEPSATGHYIVLSGTYTEYFDQEVGLSAILIMLEFSTKDGGQNYTVTSKMCGTQRNSYKLDIYYE